MKTTTKLGVLLLALMMLLAACGPAATDPPNGPDAQETPAEPTPTPPPDVPIAGGPILHAWCWSFNTIAENMQYIADAGFVAVQTSPITEHIEVGGRYIGAPGGIQPGGSPPDHGIWWVHYQPISFRIGNYHLGTEEEFAEMCRVAREHGVKVIVDVIPNHMTGNMAQIRDEIRDIEGGAFNPTVASIHDWNDRYQVTQLRLLGLADLNTRNPNVQQKFLEFLQRVIELGASGFRYDAAKHIELPDDDPEFASDFWPVVLDNGAEFQYGEVLGNEAGNNRYADFMPITDDLWGWHVASLSRSMRQWPATLEAYRRNVPPEQLVTWVESHDTFANEGQTADLTETQITMGWALLASREGSTPLFFSRPDGSEPGIPGRWGNNLVGPRGNDHFKSPEITALNWFKRDMAGQGERFTNPLDTEDERDFSLLMVERGEIGAILINGNEDTATLDGVDTQLADGIFIDRITGNEFTVENGALSGEIGAETVAVLRTAEDG